MKQVRRFTFSDEDPVEFNSPQELYKDYKKKIKSKTEEQIWQTVIATEAEKLFYFILA